MVSSIPIFKADSPPSIEKWYLTAISQRQDGVQNQV